MVMFFNGPSGWGTTGIQWDQYGYGTDPKTGNRIDKQGNIIYDAQGNFVGGQPPGGAAPGAPVGVNTGGRVKWAGGKAGDIDASGRAYGSLWSDIAPGGTKAGTVASGSAGSTGGYSTDAQRAQVNADYDESLKDELEMMNDDLVQKGIYAGGVGAQFTGKTRAANARNRAAELERLRNMGWQAEWQKKMAEEAFARDSELAKQQRYSGSQRFGTGDSADLANMFAGLFGQGQTQPGFSTKGAGAGAGTGGGGSGSGSGAGTSKPMNDPVTGEPIKGTPDYFNRWQAWFRQKQAAKKAAPAVSAANTGMDAVKGGFDDMSDWFSF